VTQQIHSGKICFNIYYEPATSFARLRDHRQVALQEYVVRQESNETGVTYFFI